MEKIGLVSVKTFSVLGQTITVNWAMLVMTWVVMGLIVLMGWAATRRLTEVPGKLQSIFELIVQFFQDITVSTLGPKEGKRLLPLIVSIFIFILISNWIGIIPNLFAVIGVGIALVHKLISPQAVGLEFNSIFDLKVLTSETVWYSPLLTWGGFEEPTKFLGTPLGMAILVFLVCHITAIRNKGFYKYLRGYIDDPFPMDGWKTILFPLNPFFYLNIIGQIANVVSHSFRLFGNIFGGGIIIIIVSDLLHHILIPVGLFAFFGLFAGIIQAFVFAMLAVSYINQLQ